MASLAPAGVLRVAFGDFESLQANISLNLDARFAPEFVDLNAADLEAYDAVLPLRRADGAALIRRPDLRGRKFLHPSPEAVALCHDKLALAQFLIAEGFGDIIPPLRPPGPPYPYMWKRRQGAFGLQCHVVDDPQAERGLALTDPAWFAQSLATGVEEYATHMLRAGGQIRYVSTFIYEMAQPDAVLGGRHAPAAAHFTSGCSHAGLFAAILARLDYEGVACFDYKVIDGRPLLFEINPRFGGSLVNDVTAYVDAYIGALSPFGR